MSMQNEMSARTLARKRAARRAFSLIELLLVLVIIGILATVVAMKFTGRSEDARRTAAMADIRTIDVALDAFELETGRFPTNEEGLDALVNQPAGLDRWKGPYLKANKVPLDPWGHPYVYQNPGVNNRNGYDLSSYGQDGREGGDDITNWSK